MSPELRLEQDRIVAQVSEYIEAMTAYHQATGKEATRELSAYVNRSLGQIGRFALARMPATRREFRGRQVHVPPRPLPPRTAPLPVAP